MSAPARPAAGLIPVADAAGRLARLGRWAYRRAGLVVIAFLAAFSFVAFYYAATQLNAAETAAWHRLVPDSFVRNIVLRDGAFEVVPAMFIARAWAWDHAKMRGKLHPLATRLTGWSLPRLIVALAFGFLACAPGFFLFIGAYSLVDSHPAQVHHALAPFLPWMREHAAHVKAAVASRHPGWLSRLGALTAVASTDGSKKAAVLAGTFAFGGMAMRVPFDSIQLWFAEQMWLRRPDGTGERWWQPIGLRRRYRDVCAAGGVPAGHMASHRGFHRWVGRVCVGLLALAAPFGIYILEVIAKAH